jgi:uncharacterized membrane protein YccC
MISGMAASGTALPSLRRASAGQRQSAPPKATPWWAITWSKPAALRALRATLVMPALFAITYKGMGSLQVAMFAAFGTFATLVMAGFSGTRKDKTVAHLGLAIAGSVALSIGTLASGHWYFAAIATLVVAFIIFFGGAISPNAAAGTNAALLAFVLPVASPGGASTIPDRLLGWWMASVIGTIAVLALATPASADRIRGSAARLAASLSTRLEAALNGQADSAARDREASITAKHQLIDAFTSTPYPPTGLAIAGQALGNVAQVLEWSTALLCDAFDGHDLSSASPEDRDLLARCAVVYADVATLLSGGEATPDLDGLETARAASARAMASGDTDAERAAHGAHAQAIAVAARTAAADALIAAHRADPDTIADSRMRWYGATSEAGRVRASRMISRHATARSVWTVNSLRGAIALAAAVTVADVSGVQHAFWVVLGTMSVLRSNAAGTGATAARALGGTIVGFVIGAALLLAIGTTPTALWIVLPLGVVVAAYAPGTAPFAFGQAAFTIVVAILFNILVPVGWKVGLLRIQDVAIGCAVSLVVGLLFWPRGAGGVVGADLADAFRRGARYLTQAVDWSIGARTTPPSTGPEAMAAGLRLEDGLRAYLAEQGSKRVGKDDMWALVMGTLRLRLTANVLAGLKPCQESMIDGNALRLQAAGLALYYERLADEVANAGEDVGCDDLVSGEVDASHPRALWVAEHLGHLQSSAKAIAAPATRFAAVRRRPWWR